jgi:hypothetical protein
MQKILTIAGFTADASLSRTDEVYRGNGERNSGSDAVQLAQFYRGASGN